VAEEAPAKNVLPANAGDVIQPSAPHQAAWTRGNAPSYDPCMSVSLPVSVGAWRCRLCRCERYHRVSVIKRNGARYETAFFACSQCSVMFLNPTRFNALSQAIASIGLPPVVTPIGGHGRPGAGD
jgi:hypothetical protein